METRLFDLEAPPEWLDPAWWATTSNCDHLAHPGGVHRRRIATAAKLALTHALSGGLVDIVDIGAGDGALLSTIRETSGINATGYEVIPDSVRVARYERYVDVHLANVTFDVEHNIDGPFTRHVNKRTRGQRLIVCTEMLEHLEDPHALLRWLSQRCSTIVASSPHSETADRHEHNHAWAWDHDGYRALFEDNGFSVTRQTDVEWSQIIVASAVWK